MKKIFTLILLALLPIMANAEKYDAYINGIYYIFSGNEATVTSKDNNYNSYSGSVVIPESFTYNNKTYRVTHINDKAFRNCSNLTSVTIPNSVTRIDDRAFQNCTNLKFNEFNEALYLGNNVNPYLALIKGKSTNIINCEINEACKVIGGDAFYECSGLTSVIIPGSVINIGSGAFSGCNGLTSVYISDLESWCKIDFNGSTSNPLYYAHHLFLNGEEIKDLVIPNSVTSIGDNAFSGCSNLTSITIPSSVTTIGSYAFSGCSGLTSIDIPNSVTDIGWYAFSGCSSLTSVTIPNSVTSIGSYAFLDCNGLTSVIIPGSVTSIGDNAFSGCSGLTSVTLNSNALVSATWSSLKSMKSIFGNQVKIYYLGENVKNIGQYAFWGCSGLISITIPNSVTSIGWGAFRDCSGLTAVHISDLESWCKIDFYSSSSNPLNYAHHLFLNGEEIRDIAIPGSVTSIGKYAFESCTGLTSVTIPNSVTSIGNAAFGGCSGLTSITIPNSVTSIGYGAFASCSSLISITIPNSVTSIGDNAFYGCYFVYDSFVNNSSLSDSNNWGATLCDEETNDGLLISNTAVVKSRPWITSATIPNSVTSIGNYAFLGCSGLTSITIGSGVTSIGIQAFSGCSSLTDVTIPNSVTSIGNYAFLGCSSLTDVYCLAENVPETSSYAFGYTPMTSATLHVPKCSVESYKTTSPWSGFGTIVALTENKGDLNKDSKVDIADAVTVLNIMAAGEYNAEADINVDDKVDIADFVTILNIMAAGVTQKPVAAIVLSETLLSLQVNETRTITATVQPTDATNKNVTWKSSNESVATVDQTGKVTAIAAGSCTIICSATDGSGVKAECQVTVKEESASIVGTWEWREGNSYIRVTLNGNGTYTVTGSVDGGNFSGSGNYTYSAGYLILTGVDMGGDKIKVVSLTSTTLVLQNFPNEGNCTFYRK